jgi:hypothetical protein
MQGRCNRGMDELPCEGALEFGHESTFARPFPSEKAARHRHPKRMVILPDSPRGGERSVAKGPRRCNPDGATKLPRVSIEEGRHEQCMAAGRQRAGRGRNRILSRLAYYRPDPSSQAEGVKDLPVTRPSHPPNKSVECAPD